MKRGPKSKYRDTFPQSMIDFFSKEPYREVTETITYKDGSTKECYKEVPNDTPWFSDWCDSVGITQVTMDNWVKEDSKHFKPELFVAYKRAREFQKQFIITNGMRHNYNPAVAIFTLKNISDMRDERHLKGEGFASTTNIYHILQGIREAQRMDTASLELDRGHGMDKGRTRPLSSEEEVSEQGLSKKDM